MAYFADLTPYAYDAAPAEGGADDLNVGWLEPGQAYPIRVPADDLVDALLRCCKRPVRLYRGFHRCGFCKDVDSLEMPSVVRHGRRIHLGNGEVRVEGPDARWYAAPTLVLHYVEKHHYRPPEAFIVGVIRRAATIPDLGAAAFERLRSSSVEGRFDACLAALARLFATAPDPWLARAMAALRAARPALDPARRPELAEQLHELDRAFVVPVDPNRAPPRAMQVAARKVMQFFVYARHPAPVFEATTLELSASVLEDALPACVPEHSSRIE